MGKDATVSCKKKRKEAGRNRQPSYGILDSQSVKTAGKAEEVGYDGNKKIKGRKRHISADTQSNLLNVKVHAANIHDTTFGGEIAGQTLMKFPKIDGFSADEGYRKTTENYVKNILRKKFDISKKENPWKMVVSSSLCKLKSSDIPMRDQEVKFAPNNSPARDRKCPFFCNIHGSEEKYLKHGIIIRKSCFAVSNLA